MSSIRIIAGQPERPSPSPLGMEERFRTAGNAVTGMGVGFHVRVLARRIAQNSYNNGF
jgi:hypothetical protein